MDVGWRKWRGWDRRERETETERQRSASRAKWEDSQEDGRGSYGQIGMVNNGGFDPKTLEYGRHLRV